MHYSSVSKTNHSLNKSPQFEQISKNTQIKISFKRWGDLDQIYNKSLKVNSQFRAYQENTKQSRRYVFAPNQFIVDTEELGVDIESYILSLFTDTCELS